MNKNKEAIEGRGLLKRIDKERSARRIYYSSILKKSGTFQEMNQINEIFLKPSLGNGLIWRGFMNENKARRATLIILDTSSVLFHCTLYYLLVLLQ